VVTSDYQKIKIQELDTENDGEAARVPRTFDLEVYDALVDTCICGDIVEAIGEIKTFQADVSRSFHGNKESAIHQLYMLANSLKVIKKDIKSSSTSSQVDVDYNANKRQKTDYSNALSAQSESSQDTNMTDADFTLYELSCIRSIALTDGVLGLLCASLAPDIFGHELVKVGLLFGLVGGTRIQPRSEVTADREGVDLEDINSFEGIMNEVSGINAAGGNIIGGNKDISIRSDIHVLVVGDPGLGKSQMLRVKYLYQYSFKRKH
jgi:DNA helicase MCM8